jgi:type VI secretion system protein ImpG
MRDEQFDYYERELAFMRDQSREFAARHGAAARALLLGDNESRDPHVERLIQSFALISARIHFRLDDQYTEFTEGLLNVLYPHYLAPIPSTTLVRFELDPRKSPTADGIPISAGTTLRVSTRTGHSCRFRTCYPVRLWPLAIQDVGLRLEPPLARLKAPRSARAWLRIELDCQPKMTFPHLSVQFDRLRFSLCGKSLELATALYQLIFRHGVGVRFSRCRSGSKDTGDWLDSAEAGDALMPVGFDPNETLLPACDRSFPGYPLLTEYFTFPQKFLAFDLLGLDRVRTRLGDDGLEVAILLDILPEQVTRALRGRIDGALALGCVPAVNLFEQAAEPIALDQRRFEYRIVPDFIKPNTLEVYRVEEVQGINPRSGETTTYGPFYCLRHGDPRPGPGPGRKGIMFWYPCRKTSSVPGDEGTDLFLSLVDLNFNPRVPADSTLSVRILCTDRDEPNNLGTGSGSLKFEIEGSAAPVNAWCLAGPTAARRPSLRGGTQWRLISHLALNSLSIVDEPGGIDALKEILRIYLMYHTSHRSSSTDAIASRGRGGTADRTPHSGEPALSGDIIGHGSLIDRIRSVSSSRVTRYLQSGMAGTWCRGLEITLELDHDDYDEGKAFLFSAVLDRFFELYASINSFTELTVSSKSSNGESRIYWTPKRRPGRRPIL